MQFKIDENLPPSVAVVDEQRIRVRLVGEIDLGPEVRELPIE